MRVTDLFPPEVIDEDIRKMMGSAALGATMLASPMLGSATKAPVPAAPAAPTIPPEEIRVMAQTIWGEARSHGKEGMRAVGHVILNRAHAQRPGQFGTGISGVALHRKQFSCWNPSDPNRDKIAEMGQIDRIMQTKQAPGQPFEEWYAEFKNSSQAGEYAAWLDAKRIARDILSGSSPDPTKGATFYHTTGVHPYWADSMTPIGQHSNHIFYRD